MPLANGAMFRLLRTQVRVQLTPLLAKLAAAAGTGGGRAAKTKF